MTYDNHEVRKLLILCSQNSISGNGTFDRKPDLLLRNHPTARSASSHFVTALSSISITVERVETAARSALGFGHHGAQNVVDPGQIAPAVLLKPIVHIAVNTGRH